jgi:type II secretory pathway component GspD/PulD (secretin)
MMVGRCGAFLLLAGLLALPQGAQGQPVAKSKRAVYVVQNGDAKELAELLSKHFAGEGEVQVLPHAPSNTLLIRAEPARCDEAIKLLARLDRRPRLIAVELLIAEVLPAKDGKAVGKGPEKGLRGASSEVLDKVAALKKSGVIGSLRHIQVTTVEGRPASVKVGETKPFVAGITARPGGMAARTVFYRDTGTLVQVTAHATADNTVALELDLTDARPHVPADGIELGKDEAGLPVRAAEFIRTSLKGKVNVRSGQAVAVEGVKTESKAGNAQTLVVVGARILEAGKGGE